MDGRKRPDGEVAKDGRFSEIEVERFDSEKSLTQTHVIGRNRRVGELLCYLSLIQGHGLLAANARVSCKAAKFQDYKSLGNHEAAHYLPGRVLLAKPGQKERELVCYINDRSTKNAIVALFSRVQNLPVDFNKADSYVEQHTIPGLKKILADICQSILDDKRRVISGRVSPFVYDAYSKWIDQSVKAYQYGINRKTDIADLRENPVPPATAPAVIEESGMFDPHLWQPSSVAAYERAVRKGKSGQVTATVWNYSRQIRILGYYAHFANRDTATLNPRWVADVEQAFKP